jgi:hypothetical protein
MPNPESGYRWGRFQGWWSLAIGLVFILAGPWIGREFAFRLAMYMAGALNLCLGVGLLGRKRYGFVLFYVEAAMVIHSFFIARVHPEVYATVACWWVIPGIFYYPKRYREFGFGKPQQEQKAVAAVAEPESAAVPRRTLTDEEREMVLDRIHKRKQQEPTK